MEEEKKQTAKEQKVSLLVVQSLPTQSVDRVEIDGKETHLVTVEEALTKILESVTKIEKAVA